MHDEKGYVQFRCDWERAAPTAGPLPDALRAWRDRLFDAKLIGVYADGIGFGNLSARAGPGGPFVITGTATGQIARLGPEHLTEVTEYDSAANWLRCRGPAQASSESLSHAAVYEGNSAIRAVVHVHHLGLWQHHYDRLPTTDPAAAAGTPAMAWAIAELFRSGRLGAAGLFVMGGHREGLISFGGTIAEAAERLLEELARFEGR
jgi:L-ribulose-5-phosphate 4-epimerase